MYLFSTKGSIHIIVIFWNYIFFIELKLDFKRFKKCYFQVIMHY